MALESMGEAGKQAAEWLEGVLADPAWQRSVAITRSLGTPLRSDYECVVNGWTFIVASEQYPTVSGYIGGSVGGNVRTNWRNHYRLEVEDPSGTVVAWAGDVEKLFDLVAERYAQQVAPQRERLLGMVRHPRPGAPEQEIGGLE